MRTIPVKLVHVTTAPQTLGFFSDHIDYLMKRGFEIHLVSSHGEKGERLAAEKGVSFHPVPMSRAISPLQDVSSLLALRKLFLSIKPDIVHSHTPKAGLLGTIAARMAGVPIVFLSQFGLPQMTLRGGRRRLLNLLTRISCGLAHRVWIDSPSMRDHVVGAGLCSADKAVTIGNGSVNGVDAEGEFSAEKRNRGDRDRLRTQLGIPCDALVLGYVGRIVRDKGMHELALAWKELKRSYSNLHLLVIGEAEAKDPVLPEDRSLFESDPAIHMPGFSTDVAGYMAAMDVFVMPSYREGFGVTNIEAAAMELPVVSTRIPGCIDSVKDGETGLLVPAGNSEKLAEAIKVYLDDPELRAAHGKAGRLRVLRDFRPQVIWEGLYQEYTRFIELKNNKEIACPACHQTGPKKLRRKIGEDSFVSCPVCSFQFIHPYVATDKTFDDYSWTKAYTDNYESYVEPVIYSLRKKIEAVEKITGRKVGSFLDVGCGNGLYLHAANVLGLRNLGTDVDKVNVEFARGKGLKAVAAALEDLDVGDKFDFVHLKAVLHLVPDPGLLLSKARDFLASGGTMYIDVPNQGSLFSKLRMLRNRTSYGQLQLPLRRGAFNYRSLNYLSGKAGLRIINRVFSYPGNEVYYPILGMNRSYKMFFRLFSFFRLSSILGIYLEDERGNTGGK